MSESAGRELTAEGLVEALADAGEFDAGVEVLDVLRMRNPDAPWIVRLQARLFAAPPADAARRRKVFEILRAMGVEGLARRGAFIECAIACRVLAAAFPEDHTWQARRARYAIIASPMSNPRGDPRRARVDELLAGGSIADAHDLLRELVKEDPTDASLTPRVEILRGLLFDPTHTRPYRAVTGDVTPMMASRGESGVDAWAPEETTARDEPATSRPPTPPAEPASLHDTSDDVSMPSIPPTPGGDVSVARRKIVRLA